MCGIAGTVAKQHDSESARSNLERMVGTLSHRGPNDRGVWLDAESGVGLAHSRLSIVDLSQAGHQPMASPCGRYQVVLNGEIYNFRILREELLRLGHSFRGNSDTEVILAAFVEWGLLASVTKFVGMFAFALFDREEHALFLVRDRIGEKPLYYGWQGDTFLFASELRAMRAHPAWRGTIDRNALSMLIQSDYIASPRSIYEAVAKVVPGTIVRIEVPRQGLSRVLVTQTYWSLKEVVEKGQQNPFAGSDSDAIDALEGHLKNAVEHQMLADVPVGAFLSGGVDSSLIAALMQSISSSPIKTFAIGFEQPEFDESPYAAAVAKHLGSDHTSLKVGVSDILSVVPKLPEIYDEPLSDSSQIPTYLVAKLARETVTVSLSGDAGDELFAGYPRYETVARTWAFLRRAPEPLRLISLRAIQAFPQNWWDSLFRHAAPLLPRNFRNARFGGKTHSFAGLLGVRSPEELHQKMMSRWGSQDVVLGSRNLAADWTQRERWPVQENFIERMMFLDMISYLPDDILAKVDRAAMASSLETRIPLLDHRVVEFAWTLPHALKQRNNQTKWLLRQVLYRYVPKELIERPKKGFSVPLAQWLRGPLREWAEDHLSRERLVADQLLSPDIVRTRWQAHKAGQANWETWLWNVLMFQSWHEHWHSKVHEAWE